MSRRAFTDYLQNFPFWLMDVAPVESLALPIFTPIFGFSAISIPEATLEVESLQEGGRVFKRKVIKGGDISNMILQRGVRIYDSDFYRWFTSAAYGDTNSRRVGSKQLFSIGGPTFRRKLVLIQYFARTPGNNGDQLLASAAITAGAATAGGFLGGSSLGGIAQSLGTNTLGAGVSGAIEYGQRVPARLFFLSGCIPVRYKPASDMDAKDSEVSVAEIEIAIENMEEISLAN